VVIIAVKPHFVPDVLQDIASVAHANHLVISVAAGFLISNIERVRLFSTGSVECSVVLSVFEIEACTGLG